MRLREFDTFRAKWFKGLVMVDKVDGNDLHVIIDPEQPKRSTWQETWNLEHTIYGFHRGDYFQLTKSSIEL